MSEIVVRSDDPRWQDVPTPLGPDMQVRARYEFLSDAIRIQWRVKPCITALEARGITREESDVEEA